MELFHFQRAFHKSLNNLYVCENSNFHIEPHSFQDNYGMCMYIWQKSTYVDM